jgi:hypothetical protein
MNVGEKLDPLEVAVEVAAAAQLDPLEVVPNVVRSEVFGLFLNQWRTAQENRLRNVEALWWARWNEGLDGWSDGRSTKELVEQCGWDDATVGRVEQCLASLVNAAKEQKRRADAYQHATEAHKQANQQARDAFDPQAE